MKPAKLHKPFAMIREFQLADWFTLANAVCGTGAIFSMLTYLQTTDIKHVYYAGAMVLASLIFDILDGRIARWRQQHSVLGRELDSLADIISFGVAPAVIAYGCGMQGLYDRIILTGFVACGVSRLARYNVTAEALSADSGKVKYFETASCITFLSCNYSFLLGNIILKLVPVGPLAGLLFDSAVIWPLCILTIP